MDGRSSPAARRKHSELARRQNRDADNRFIGSGFSPKLSESLARPDPPRYTRSSDFDPTPTDALDDDLGAPMLSRTSHEVERVRSVLGVRAIEALGDVQNKQDAPHVDLTSTTALARFDLARRPVEPVPLSMKQVHPARAQRAQAHSAEAVPKTQRPGVDFPALLATLPLINDHSGAAIPWVGQNALAAEIVQAIKQNRPDRARIFCERLLKQGRITRAELVAYVSKQFVSQ